MDINLYVKDGKVSRTDIVADIKNHKLTSEDVERLLKDDRITDSFIGIDYSKKKPMEEWDQEYLNKLSYAAIGEAFNKDYLWHLFNVAEYVGQKRGKKNTRAPLIIAVISVIVATILTVIILISGNK